MYSKTAFCLLFLFFTACHSQEKKTTLVVPENGAKKLYGTIDRDTVYVFTIKNGQGIRADISNYGATLLELWTPDKNGNPGNIILGYDSLQGYLQKSNPYFGAVVGRFANRIGGARFTLDGKEYTLADNDRGNSLHGGLKGFDKVIWNVDQVNDSSVALSYTSRDGEEGYPGTLNARVVYTVNAKNALTIDYTALTDKKTPVNLTNHAYFNLSAGKDSTILGEELFLNASKYTPVNDSLIPTGKIVTVAHTPMDFEKSKKIGTDIDRVKGGYDHNFVINRKDSGLSLAAELYDPGSGRQMSVWTTQPGIQFYTGNFLNGKLSGRNGVRVQQHGALCLETQHFPDAPNQPGFPNVILSPGQVYHEKTVYSFSVKK